MSVTGEKPYSEREMVYTPAKPFADAIDEWIAEYRRRWRTERMNNPLTPQGKPARVSGIEELAHRAGLPARSLRRYQTGESRHISIDAADRLATALGLPLRTIVDDDAEFLPLGELYRRERLSS